MSNFTMPRFVYSTVSILLVAIAAFFTLRIALDSATDVHPDEYNHADAFCFYESHWWPPPLNADGLRYSPSGNSRVYEKEVVYYIFGKFAALLGPVIEPRSAQGQIAPLDEPFSLFLPIVKAHARCHLAYRTYRLLNVMLLVVTLAVLFWAGRRERWIRSLALLMLGTPMAVYMYSYANSDAWGLSMSAFLLTCALTLHRKVKWRWWDALLLGFLTAMVFLSKSTFWLSIPLAYLILAHRAFELWQKERETLRSLVRSWLPLVLVTTFLLILPMRVVYPLLQGDYEAKLLAMQELRSRADFRPSAPQGGYLLKQRGFPITIVTADPFWWQHTYQSFYGYFGYWTKRASDVALYGATIAALVAVACTYFDFVRRREAYSSLARLMLLVSPLFVLANIPASIYHSWAIDFQPQGRYLLCALLPLSLLVGGAANDEPRWLVVVRLLVWLLLLGLSFYTLWELAIGAATWGTT